MTPRQLAIAIPAARHTDPATSHQAALSVKQRTITLTQAAILRILRYGPATDEQIADMYLAHGYHPPSSPSGLRTRRRELADRGKVRDTGRRVRMRSGRNAIVWALA